MPTYQLVTNVAPSTTEGYALKPIVPDFSKFKLRTSDESEKEAEVSVVSLVSPLGFKNSFKFGAREIDNIYKGTKIDPGLYPPVKSGVSVVFQTNETWTMEDPQDASLPKFALPIEAHCVIRIPNNDLIKSSDLVGLLNRMLGSVLNSDLSSLDALIRGSVNPL